jgi:hypothetical protein
VKRCIGIDSNLSPHISILGSGKSPRIEARHPAVGNERLRPTWVAHTEPLLPAPVDGTVWLRIAPTRVVPLRLLPGGARSKYGAPASVWCGSFLGYVRSDLIGQEPQRYSNGNRRRTDKVPKRFRVGLPQGLRLRWFRPAEGIGPTSTDHVATELPSNFRATRSDTHA